MILIYLGKRQAGEYVDYQFLEIENDTVEYLVKTPTQEQNSCETYNNLKIGSLFVDGELITNKPSSLQIETILMAFKMIQPIANELKKTYKSAKGFKIEEDSIEIFKVPAPSQFKHWKYIMASDLLNRYLSNYKYSQSKRTILSNIKEFLLGEKEKSENKEMKR